MVAVLIVLVSYLIRDSVYCICISSSKVVAIFSSDFCSEAASFLEINSVSVNSMVIISGIYSWLYTTYPASESALYNVLRILFEKGNTAYIVLPDQRGNLPSKSLLPKRESRTVMISDVAFGMVTKSWRMSAASFVS